MKLYDSTCSTREAVREFSHLWIIQSNEYNMKHRTINYSFFNVNDCDFNAFEKEDEKKYSWEMKLKLKPKEEHCLFELLIRSHYGLKSDGNVKLSLHLITDRDDDEPIELERSEVMDFLDKNPAYVTWEGQFPAKHFASFAAVGKDVQLLVLAELKFNDPKPQIGGSLEADWRSTCLKISDDFEELFLTKRLSDMVIVVGDEKILAHKLILSARSDVFAAMIKRSAKTVGGKLAVEEPNLSAEVMNEVLRFVYAGKVKDIQGLAGRLVAPALKYGIADLLELCERRLVASLRAENVREMLVLVSCYPLDLLRRAILGLLREDRAIFRRQNLKDLWKALSSVLLGDMISMLADVA